MQSTSALFKSLLAAGAAKEYRYVIAGENYGEDRVVSASGSSSSMSKAAEIGRCMAKELQAVIREPGAIPRMAEVIVQVRLNDGTSQSEWLDKGTYYVDTRSKDPFGVLTINAFDPMLKADQPYIKKTEIADWPADETDVVEEIAELMGVAVDSRTVLAGYDVKYPNQDWTMREMLGWIAASNCGNWIITPKNELLLVPLNADASYLGANSNAAILFGDSVIVLSTGYDYDKARDVLAEDDTTGILFGDSLIIANPAGGGSAKYLDGKGQNIQGNARSLQNLGLLQAFTGVKLWYDRENTYEDQEIEVDGEPATEKVEVENAYYSGTDEGRILEADCPWATQEMADAILAKIEGYCYQGAIVEEAIISPAVELGDVCICDGIGFLVSQILENFNALYAPTLSSPGDDEVDHEYHYKTQTDRALNRKATLGENYYGFKVTRENGIEVVNIVDGVETTRMILNSSVQAFYNANGDEALYFDAEAGQYKFVGDVTVLSGSLNINNNFIVDTDGNVTCNGSVILQGSETKIVAPLIMSNSFCVFPEDATDAEIGALTIPTGFNLYDRESGSLYNFLTIYQYGTHTHLTNGQGGAADLNINYPIVNFDGNSLYHNGSGYTGADAKLATIGKVKDLITNGW